jgi:hypothetical protein
MQEWYIHDKGTTTGPFTTAQVKDALAQKKIAENATFCLSGTTTWRPLAALPELAVVVAPKTELPVVAETCGQCQCPVARFMKKAVVLAFLAAVAYVLWIKLGHPAPVSRPF